MPESPAWPTDPKDRMRVREAETAGEPFLVLRDGDGVQRIVVLDSERAQAVIGRAPDSEVAIEWDDRVSRTHAKLERVGREWSVEDDGLSRNGTYVNEERVPGAAAAARRRHAAHRPHDHRLPDSGDRGQPARPSPSRASPRRRRSPRRSAGCSTRSAARASTSPAP